MILEAAVIVFVLSFYKGYCTLAARKQACSPMIRLLLFTLLCVFGKPNLAAQSPSYAHYGVQEGLPGNVVYCAAQDARGFIWFGTDKGLARFDGVRFQVFGMKDGLPGNEVIGLFEDSRQRLWIACFSQKPCYMADGKFVTANNNALLANIQLKNSIGEFSEDSQGNIWITDREARAFIFKDTSVEIREFPTTTARVEQRGNLLFMLGFPRLIELNSRVSYAYDPLLEGDKRMSLVSIGASEHQFLIALTNKLILVDWKDGQFTTKDSILQTGGRVTTDQSGHFWVCPASKGAIFFANSQHDLSNPTVYLPEIKVNAVFEDRQGTLWFGTNGDGIYVRSPGKAASFTQKDGLTTNKITALTWDRRGYLLAGDDGGSLYEFKGHKIHLTALTPPENFNRSRQIISMPDFSRWIATDAGLFQQKGSVIQRISNLVALKCMLAKPGKLWFGNHASLGYISDSQEQIRLSPLRTMALGDDTEDNIWAGKMEGLYSLRDTFHYNWGDRFPALKNHIVAIHKAGLGKIWVVTSESGLLLLSVKNGAVIRLDTINRHLKRPIDNIQALYIDSTAGKFVWLATNSGVYGLDPTNWTVVNYTHRDGLADDDVNCVLVVRDTLWAGTVAGLSYLPLREQGGSADFPTFVTELHYQSGTQQMVVHLLDSLFSQNRLLLPPDAAMITLYLAGLDYRSQGKMEYICTRTTILPPIQWWTRHNLFNWITNGFRASQDSNFIDNNSLNFGISLPSGCYKIQVTAVNAKGLSSKHPAQWMIIKRAYWYNTLWSDLLLWGVFIYIIWQLSRIRVDYRKLHVEVAELQLMALQSQINPHFVGNSINAIQQFFYPPNPLAASHYIELFTRLLRRTIFLSEKHFNSFAEELAYDSDYLEMIKLRFGERFHYEITGTDGIPPDLCFPSMLLQPLLENATIHGLAPEGVSNLLLQFSFNNKKFQCRLTDNGMGYNAAKARPARNKEYKSKGLEMLHKKVAAFNELYIDLHLHLEIQDLSQVTPPAQGTQVRISFYPESNKNKRNGSLTNR